MSKYRDNRRPGVLYTRNFLLRSICGIYLMAFVSFYYQSEGLYGNNGIVPAVTQFKASPTSPNLLRFAGSLNLDLSTAVDLLALLGAVVSFAGFVSRYMISMPLFAILWLLYYSLTDIMGPFVSQADNLLLEAGIICVFMAPANPRKQNPNDRLCLLMMRWLLFRFLFTSGAVKLASQCPHWWRLDGLERHLETMPLPTQLTWYSFNYIPKHLLQLTMAYVNVSELLVSFLFLAPPFAFRKFAFYWHLFLQFHIIATGNYGYLNFLVVVLLFALLNDSTFSKKKESQLGDWLLMLVTLVGVGYAMWYLFGIKMDNGVFSFKLNFNQERYNDALSTAVKVAPCMCLIGILGTFLNEVVSNESIRNQKSTIKKIFICLKTSLFMLICLTLLSLSVVPLRRILPETRVDNTDLGNLYEQATPYRMVNEYGKHLVKMRSERLEIVMEHSESAEGPWTEYPFAYKPGPEKSNLSMAGPYFPRLDFQLWEAAPSNIGKHLWVSSLTFRLLQNDPAVLRLLGVTVPPRKKPTYVRAMLYKLKYSPLPGKDGQWKRRALAEFLPAQSLDSELLATHLKSLRIPKKNPKPVVKNALVKSVLDKTRTTVSMLEGSFLTIAILATGFALIATKRT